MMMAMIKIWQILSELKATVVGGKAVISNLCAATVQGNLQDDKAERLQERNLVSYCVVDIIVIPLMLRLYRLLASIMHANIRLYIL